jgi:hypothetical protein
MNVNYVDAVLHDIDKLKVSSLYAWPIKLIFLWSIMDAWAYSKSKLDRPRERVNYLRKLKTEGNIFFECYEGVMNENGYNSVLNIVKSIDLKISPAGVVNDIVRYYPNNIGQDMIELIYQIRNKIVHGEWFVDWSTDADNSVKVSVIQVVCTFFDKWVHLAHNRGAFNS